MRNVVYRLQKEHAKSYILRLLKRGHAFEVAPHIRFVEVTVNIEAEAPNEMWLFNIAKHPIYDE